MCIWRVKPGQNRVKMGRKCLPDHRNWYGINFGKRVLWPILDLAWTLSQARTRGAPPSPLRGPVKGPRCVFGTFQGVKPAKSGGRHGGKVPLESLFGPSSPKYGRGMARTAQNGAERAIRSAHRGPLRLGRRHFVPPVHRQVGSNAVKPGPIRSRGGPFWVIFAMFGIPPPRGYRGWQACQRRD